MVVSEFLLTSSGKTVEVRPSKANGLLVYRVFFPNQTKPIAALRFDDANVCKDLWADQQVGLEAMELAVRTLFCVMAKAFFDRKLTPYFIPQEVRSRFPPKNPTAAWVNLDAMSKRFYKYTQDVEERKNAAEIRVQTSGGHLLDPMPSWLDKNNRADQWEFQLYEAVRLHDYELTPWKHTITPISHPSQLTGKDREENLISLEKTLTAPAPGFSEDEGESWRWGNYILTLQKSPKTVLEVMGKISKTSLPQGLMDHLSGMGYPYAMSVFFRNGNPTGISSGCPHVILTLELYKGEQALSFCYFYPGGRMNFGEVEGKDTKASVRQLFFAFLKGKEGFEGEPNKIGTISDGMQQVGVHKQMAQASSKAGCLSSLLFFTAVGFPLTLLLAKLLA